MKITSLHERDIKNLLEFNKLVHPSNSTEEIRAYLDHWLAKVPDAMEYVITQKEGDEIVGVNFLSPMSYLYNGKMIHSQWAFDLYVKEEYRKRNYGSYLLLAVKSSFPTHCATGSGPNAVKLLSKLKATQIGQIHKYVGISNPLYMLTSFSRGIVPIMQFPKSVYVKGQIFSRVAFEDLPDINTPYNKSILEINHDTEFLKWKFFNNYREYAFYFNSDNNNYIVLRTIIKKHITLLMVSDYRCNVHSTDQVETLCLLAKKVAKKIGVAFVFCGSSLTCVDMVLEKLHFKAIGRHRPIMTYDKSYKNASFEEQIQARDFILVTLADSDGEPI